MKEQINKILKDLDLTTVRMTQSECGGRFRPRKPFKNFEGRAIKAIEGSSIGPMTMTSVYAEHNRALEQKIMEAFRSIAKRVSLEDRIVKIEVDLGNRRVREIHFHWDLFPTYTRSVDLDPGYKTYWYVMHVNDRKLFETK